MAFWAILSAIGNFVAVVATFFDIANDSFQEPDHSLTKMVSKLGVTNRKLDSIQNDINKLRDEFKFFVKSILGILVIVIMVLAIKKLFSVIKRCKKEADPPLCLVCVLSTFD